MSSLYDFAKQYTNALNTLLAANDAEAGPDPLAEKITPSGETAYDMVLKYKSYLKKSSAIKAAEDEMKATRQELETEMEAIKSSIRDAMLACGIKRMTSDEHSVSVGNHAEVLEVNDENQIPINFYVHQKPKLDREALKKALQNGEKISGASLIEGKARLTIV